MRAVARKRGGVGAWKRPARATDSEYARLMEERHGGKGPSIVILRRGDAPIRRQDRPQREGNSRLDKEPLHRSAHPLDPQFRQAVPDRTAGTDSRIHFMLFGSYAIDARKENRVPRLQLGFRARRRNEFLRLLGALLDGDLDDLFDWRTDVMSDAWDARLAPKLARNPGRSICDALPIRTSSRSCLDQSLFDECVRRPAKVANSARANAITASCSSTAKKKFVLRKHWQAAQQIELPARPRPVQFGNARRPASGTFDSNVPGGNVKLTTFRSSARPTCCRRDWDSGALPHRRVSSRPLLATVSFFGALGFCAAASRAVRVSWP